MTTDEIKTLIINAKTSSGEKWAAVENYIAEQVDSDATGKVTIAAQAQADAEAAKVKAQAAIDQIKAAVLDPAKGDADILAIVTDANKPASDKRIAEIDAQLATLQAERDKLSTL